MSMKPLVSLKPTQTHNQLVSVHLTLVLKLSDMPVFLLVHTHQS